MVTLAVVCPEVQPAARLSARYLISDNIGTQIHSTRKAKGDILMRPIYFQYLVFMSVTPFQLEIPKCPP